MVLMPRSLLVFSGKAYTTYAHSIEPDDRDEMEGAANSALFPEGGHLRRGGRSSLTVCLSAVLTACPQITCVSVPRLARPEVRIFLTH